MSFHLHSYASIRSIIRHAPHLHNGLAPEIFVKLHDETGSGSRLLHQQGVEYNYSLSVHKKYT